MASCRCCGISIPDGQPVCSMCYGDPYYGRDGYYLAELERQEQANIEKQWQDRIAEEQMQEPDQEQNNEDEDFELPF